MSAGTRGHVSTARPDAQNVRAFFETDAYLSGNAAIVGRARLVQRMLAPLAHSRVVDLGCGDGSLSLPLLGDGNVLTLVDFSSSMLDRARLATPDHCWDQVEFVQSDIAAFRPDDLYDVVICVGVLAHVPSVPATIEAVGALLRPGGRAVIQLSDSALLVNRLLERYRRLRAMSSGGAGQVVNRLSAVQLLEIAKKRGLQVVGSERHSFELPGTRSIPYRWRRAFELYTLDHPSVARHGIETLFLFEKVADVAHDTDPG